MLSPMAVHRDDSSLFCTLDLLLGAYFGLELSTYVEVQHQADNGWPKVNMGHAEPHG